MQLASQARQTARKSSTPHSPLAAYGTIAQAAGLAIVPTAADAPKTPIIKSFLDRRSAPSAQTIQTWIHKFASANYGYIPAQSGHVVIDIDHPDDLPAILQAIAPLVPPVLVRTPRGGYHLPFRAPPVGMIDLRPRFRGEVRGNALVVGPGSIDPQSGKAYVFERGGFGDLPFLPLLPADVLDGLIGSVITPPDAPAHSPSPLAIVHEGERNNATFEHLRNLGRQGYFNTRADVLAEAHHYNATACDPSLPAKEVEQIAASVWKMIAEGRCYTKRPATVEALPAWVVERLRLAGKQHDHCQALAIFLFTQWRKPGRTFAISAKSMTADELLPGWSEGKYRRTTNKLVELGILERISPADYLSCTRSDGARVYRGRTSARYRIAAPKPPHG